MTNLTGRFSFCGLRTRAIPLLLVLVAAGCGPIHDGPQLREEPPGLTYTTGMSSARTPLRNRPQVRQITYWEEPRSAGGQSVLIVEYEGEATLGEAEEAREVYAKSYGRHGEVGPALRLSVEGRPAVYWIETQRKPVESRREEDVTNRILWAVVPWSGKTYGLECASAGDALLSENELRVRLQSFTVYDAGRATGRNYVILGILVLAAVTADLVRRVRVR